jgi:aminopeptidase-like protein
MKKKINTFSPIVEDILNNLADLNRNLVSDEVEESLEYLSKYIDLKVHRYKTGSKCWTWEVPPKWRIKEGYVKNNEGIELVSFRNCPLHVMSYSVPVSSTMKGEELLKHVYVHNEIPHAIPFEFSYYKSNWGFCLTHEQKNKIKADEVYEVFIDSGFVDDYLSVGEYTIHGKSDEYIVFLSHLDHPFQVNDGLIGGAVNVALATLLKEKDFYYNYTFLFVPESIGSIAFLSQNEDLIPKIKYAVFVEMVGLDNPLVLQKSYKGDELINRYALYAMNKLQGVSEPYPYLTVAANDEKIFNSPGVNIPSISITRVNQKTRLEEMNGNRQKEKYELIPPYPEYHTHLDNLDTVNFQRVNETIEFLYDLCRTIEMDFIPVRTFKGPVFLSKYDLWVDWRSNSKMNESIMYLMYYLEGDMTAFQIAEKLELEFEDVADLLKKFYENGLIKKNRVPIGFDRESKEYI